MFEFIFLPWIACVIILACVLLTAGKSLFAVWAPFAIISVVAVIFTMRSYRLRKQADAMLGVLVLIACFAAFIVGLITYLSFLKEYGRMGRGASYSNVLPSEAAQGKNDATSIMFTSDSAVDTSRSYGFVNGRTSNGGMFCVAPVANQYTSSEHIVQYWASGTDCCGSRGSFSCGPGPNAHGATVWGRESTASQQWKDAVSGAEAVHNLQSGKDYLLLHMTDNPEDDYHNRWDSSVKLVLLFGAVYLLISCIFGYLADSALKR